MITLSLLIICRRTDDLRIFCNTLNVCANPLALFVVLTDSVYNEKLILYLIMMIVCDAPFIDGNMQCCILRSGRIRWFTGTVFYIILMVLIYWLCVFIICVLSIASVCEWTADWGRVFRSLLKTGEIADLQGDLRYLKAGSALELFLISFSLKCMVSVMLAFITWLFNSRRCKNGGVIIATAFILMHGHITGWFVPVCWKFISPVTLSNLNMLNIDGTMQTLSSIPYAFAFLIICNATLTVMLLQKSRTFEVETSVIYR